MAYTTANHTSLYNSGYIEYSDVFAREGITPSAGSRDFMLFFDTFDSSRPLDILKQSEGNRLYQTMCLYVMKGMCRFEINGKTETLTEGMMMTTMSDCVINPLYISADASYFMVVIYPKLIIEIFKDLGMTYSNTKIAQRYFISDIPEEQKAVVLNIYTEMKRDMLGPIYEYQHLYQRCMLTALFVENMNIHKHDLIQQENGNCNSRQYDIYCRFLTALNKHSQEHRTVQYYANLLGISSKYLSFVCICYSKKNASTWIDESVAKKAKVLMTVHGSSFNDICRMLNFQNISSFSRFFKRVTGQTPKEYVRQSQMI